MADDRTTIRALLFPTGQRWRNRALVIVLAPVILASLCTVCYAVLMPAHGDPLTGFYLLGPDGRAGGYPSSFRLGDTKPVIVGVTDHECRGMTYDLVVALYDGTNASRMYEENLTLADGQTWEKKLPLTPDVAGTDMKLEFLLYADGNYTAPYRALWLMVNVSPDSP